MITRKIYYNLTMLQNGWVLKMPRIYDDGKSLSTLDVEEYHPCLEDAYDSIVANFELIENFK